MEARKRGRLHERGGLSLSLHYHDTHLRRLSCAGIALAADSRLSRSLLHLLTIWEELEKAGMEFVSVTEPYDSTTPHGKAFLQMAGVFAELERHLIGERTSAGLRHRRDTLEVYARTPFGFTRVLTPHRQEAEQGR